MKVSSSAKLEAHITLVLTESEARALNAISLYGTNQFLECFYANLGESYLKPHEEGLKSLFAGAYDDLTKPLSQLNELRKVLKDH